MGTFLRRNLSSAIFRWQMKPNVLIIILNSIFSKFGTKFTYLFSLHFRFNWTGVEWDGHFWLSPIQWNPRYRLAKDAACIGWDRVHGTHCCDNWPTSTARNILLSWISRWSPYPSQISWNVRTEIGIQFTSKKAQIVAITFQLRPTASGSSDPDLSRWFSTFVRIEKIPSWYLLEWWSSECGPNRLVCRIFLPTPLADLRSQRFRSWNGVYIRWIGCKVFEEILVWVSNSFLCVKLTPLIRVWLCKFSEWSFRRV